MNYIAKNTSKNTSLQLATQALRL